MKKFLVVVIIALFISSLFLLLLLGNKSNRPIKSNSYNSKSISNKTILIKFPSRSRPNKLLSTFKTYMEKANNISRIKTLISLDEDDKTVTEDLLEKLRSISRNIYIHIGESKGKIGAVNRDMEYAGKYDILLLASDDMIPIVKGYDDIIRNHMTDYYPDNDGVLWYNDEFQGKNLNTLCILGKRYYDRFGYIYHPSYKSLWCDNEFMEVANRLGKQTYFDKVIIKHEHPSNVSTTENDNLYKNNDKFYDSDHKNFIERKAKSFP